MITKTKREIKYKQFTIIIEFDGAGTGNKCFTWVVNRADGSNLDISEFEHETENDAIEEAKQCIDDWYENE